MSKEHRERGIVVLRIGRVRGGGVDQLVQVLEPVGAVALAAVIRLQSAVLDHVLDDLGQRQLGAGGAHRFDQRHESGDAFEKR
jgi:hypothetical protein